MPDYETDLGWTRGTYRRITGCLVVVVVLIVAGIVVLVFLA